MDQKKKKSGDDDIDHLYMDLSMVNSNSQQFKQARFQESRTQAIIEDPSEWYASIVRFEVPTHNIPIFIATPLVGGATVNTLTYSVTIDIDSPATYSHTTNLTMEVLQRNQPSPTDPNDPTNKVKFWQHYSVMDYQQFITMINHALDVCWTKVKLDNPGLVGTSQPYVTFDMTSGLMALVTPITFLSTDRLRLWFSNDLYEKVRLQAYQLWQGQTTKYAKLKTQRTFCIYGVGSGSSIFTIPTGYPGAGLSAHINYQTYSSLYSWNDLVSIVITSSLPTLPEVISGPVSENGKSTTRQIFTDFVPQITSGTELRNSVVYTPTAEYRLVNMLATAELRSIGFEMWWQDSEQQLYPILLDPFDNASMKIMFRKKSFNKI
jgi:hypothetical protein